MSDRMTPIPFSELIHLIMCELNSNSTVFAIDRRFKPEANKKLELFSEYMETPFGPAAGPHTQLAQNIIAAYYAGSRFFELKTVQTLDGEDLPVAKPCILAEDECYNVEWSTELTVQQAFDEYVKAWFILKILTKMLDWGDPCGFMFNMSVGYDFQGISSPKIDSFIEGLKDASSTPIWAECREICLRNLDKLPGLTAEYVNAISPKVCTSITLSTLHGCPPQEIERIASYLIEKKQLNTFVKCNPTLLGYDFCRRTLDKMGFDYIAFDEHHFQEDLQWSDALPMFTRLKKLATANKLSFGLKLTNTFPVDIKRQELPGNEMYMSGRSLYPLTMELARRISLAFDGQMRISYSGGADNSNIRPLFQAGIWPITMATTMLKPGGYQRLTQIAEKLNRCPYIPFSGVSVGRIGYLAQLAQGDSNHLKAIKPAPSRKIARKVPRFDCFIAPCSEGCPIHQDIPEYISLVGQKKYVEALRLITAKNPLPFITGTICNHKCQEKCTRNFYDESVRIRNAKLLAAREGLEELIATTPKPVVSRQELVAIIGGGPAGMALGYFITRGGAQAAIFEKNQELGGIVRYVIPEFRISQCAIKRDTALLEHMGCIVKTGSPAPDLKALKAQGFTHVVYAVGAQARPTMSLEQGQCLNVIDFLEQCKAGKIENLGSDVVVIGGGNTAMDAARAAKRFPGVKHARLVYRRTSRYMPADEEELQLALEDGVEFMELLAPRSLQNNVLTCEKMALGQPDASGRRSPQPTGELVCIPCSTAISAVGEKVERELFISNGLSLDDKGLVKLNPETLESVDQPHVYVIGDAHHGPSTVVKAIADAQRVADSIVGKFEYEIPQEAKTTIEDCTQKRGIIKAYDCAAKECERCLVCNTLCECCVQVCPNRAYLPINVKDMKHPQILHLDRMCNYCGNCTAFCPYDSSPFREKYSLFSTVDEFDASDLPGFVRLKGNKFRIRDNEIKDVDIYKDEFDPKFAAIIQSVVEHYSYLL